MVRAPDLWGGAFAAADLVAHGVPVAEAARRKGLTRASLRRWMAERASPRAAKNGPVDRAP